MAYREELSEAITGEVARPPKRSWGMFHDKINHTLRVFAGSRMIRKIDMTPAIRQMTEDELMERFLFNTIDEVRRRRSIG